MRLFPIVYLRRTALASASAALLVSLAPQPAGAGGPKYIAGATYFNSAVLGQPVHWAGGQVNYYVDQGPLSANLSNQQATAMVDAAAAIWSAVPTAGVTLTDNGSLNEDVSGLNIAATNAIITAPADVTPNATNYPLAVIYDADGSVINTIFGAGSSEPNTCQNNGVFVWLDTINPDATIAHAVIVLNGLCATTPNLIAMMSFELERAFGRVLGLDYSQVNPTALTDSIPGGTQGWPVMQPLSGTCSASGGVCIPNATTLQYDDIAALNRIYPVTPANVSSFPSKQITATNTVSIQGVITFRGGYGMQGVNVVARPLDANGNPLYQYTVTTVSGATFSGNHGNPVNGYTDSNGTPLTTWGSTDSTLQGFFDLSGIPLPPGVSSASYQVTFEAIDPLYILTASVGPYADGQPTPSGTLPTLSIPALASGGSTTLTVNLADSASGGFQDAIGTVNAPRGMPGSGMWMGRISQVGQTDWFSFPVRGNRLFTIVTQALDETGAPTNSKAMPAIGVWDGFDAATANAVGAAPGLNGLAPGETWLRVAASGDDVVRIGIADERGDGRPDYAYAGFLLYADTVTPPRLPAGGGPIVIIGMGFHTTDTVLVGGQLAVVTSITPNEITAIAPPAVTGVTGSVDVEVDDQPSFYAATIVGSGISYDSGIGDSLTLLSAPANTVPIGVPLPFSVVALGSDLNPAGGVTVVYTVISGTATLSCGLPTCSITASGDGRASLNVTAVDAKPSIVTAALTNGASLQSHFSGGAPAVIAALTPSLSIAAGVTLSWTVQALVLNNGQPTAGQSVFWQSTVSSGLTAQDTSGAITNPSGLATRQLTVGPLAEGQLATINACLNGTNQCVTYTAIGARPEYASLEAVSGIAQSMSVQSTPAQITLRILDMDGNPMAGGSVALYQALYAWAPPCAAHQPCPPSVLLANQVSTATSAIDGTVNFTPASLPGIPTTMNALAAEGNTASVNITIEQHP
jgi:hypothetical protein